MNSTQKLNVLVFPCGSEIGLEIFKSLSYSTHVNLYGGSSIDDHGRFVYKNYIGNIPFVNDELFVQKINEIISLYEIDFIFPAHDSAVLKLAEEKLNKNIKCEVITSPFETCNILRSKHKTYEVFKDFIPVPKEYEKISSIQPEDLPVFLKPDIGQGSKGTHLAKTIEEIEFYRNIDNSLLALEFLPGNEYTVDCFTNNYGKLLFCEGRQRKRIYNGISVNSFTKQDERFEKFAEIINNKLRFKGVWFFQVKENNSGDFVLMEIAPRVAGTMGLVRCKGVNLPLLSLFDALGFEININKNKYEITIDRALANKYIHNIYYKNVYIDFDDTLVFEQKVNPIVISFIYQCINKSIKVYLITKHSGNLNEMLHRFKLQNVFDDIIWLKSEDEKYIHIREKESIFIDDSFSERERVSEKCRIPVFDSHMIECLMEKF